MEECMIRSGFGWCWSLRLKGLVALSVVALSLTCAGASWGSAYDPATDAYALNNITSLTGAQAWWDAGYTGKGIDVAVIDSGVVPVAGLNATGKVVNGPDLSLESQATKTVTTTTTSGKKTTTTTTTTYPFRYMDTFGHGTFMAGLIAGRDSTVTAPYSAAPASAYRGMAPDARIVSLKVATADGGTDVSQVIAAIDWVVQHAKDPGYNIRVINLSYGTNSTQSYTVDPLAYAAEQAWKKGIVVVAAAGNAGYQNGAHSECMANPAYDPSLISVAGVDTMGTSDLGDDQIGDYSSGGSGTGCKSPDFAAPGSHMQGLRNPNSYLDVNHPEGVIDDRYFRGTGTSQATAITSGAVALILQKYPNLTPDQVKQFFKSNAYSLASTNGFQQGAGEIQLERMLSATPAAATQSLTGSTGAGSLELSRGTDHIALNGVTLTGEKDIFGKPFNTTAMAALEYTASSWSGGSWNGSSWSGSSWSGNSWSGSTWSGSSWSGSSWSGSSWSGSSWSGSSWSGSSWSGSSWSDYAWS
jgi:subtilisin family serine protease